ncbi:nucleotide exchange factor GrpE [Adhaeribacter soli]|uniref:Protein GrpE n=1 Tax=Adhaeribacter soli TaxID=2607655 RepID=A0A5N1IRI9_9BACT|nr:nucleotide exchange factor GrpE [Adhaeribacter soli]KAA9327370.1 nucleotide exchange factor GrpE [Adhaeribacter soli]
MKSGKEHKSHDSEKEQNPAPEETTAQNATENEQETAVPADHQMPDVPNDALSKTEEELSEMKDKYLRLYSEFDNFRRRTAKERQDLIKSANQDMMLALLPVMDDLDRAKAAIETATDINAVKEGLELIFNKLTNVLQQKGLKPMEATGQPFDADLHEAITQTPAGDDMKGKIVDEIEKGYYLNDKVIRFAKVIIGA